MTVAELIDHLKALSPTATVLAWRPGDWQSLAPSSVLADGRVVVLEANYIGATFAKAMEETNGQG